MDRNENGLSNLLANRMPSLNGLSSNGATNLNNLNNNSLMNAFNFAAGLPLSLWDNQLISAMSQYMDMNNSLLNLKQDSSDHSPQQQRNLKRSEDDDLENKCSKDVLDLKVKVNHSNKRFKNNNDGYVQQHNQLEQLTNSKISKELSFLDNGKSFPCPECHKTFATEVDLKIHLLRHVMQHPYSCSTCGKGFKYEHTLAFHEKQHGNDNTQNNKLNLKNSNKKSSSTSGQQHQSKNDHLIDDKSLIVRKHSNNNNNNNINNNNNNNNINNNKFPLNTVKPSSIQLTLDDDDDLSTSLFTNVSKLNNSTTSSKQNSQNSSLFSSSNSSSFDFGLPNPAMSNLGIQMKSEKALINMVEGVNPSNDQTYTLYKCNLCGFAVGNLGPVTEHILTAHSTSKAFNCDKCGANFKWKNDLLLHDQLHRAMEQQATNTKLMLPSLMQNNLNNLLVNQYLNASNDQTKLDSNNNDNLLSNSNKLNGTSTKNHLNGTDSLLGLNLTKAHRKDSESSQESLNNNVSKSSKNGRSKDLKNDEFDELSKNIAVVKENITNNELGEIEEIAPGVFKCRYCDKTFDRVFSVHRHERVHTGFKPCICKVCGKGFSELRNLRHHLLRFHSDGSGRELLRRVRKDKSMNSEESHEAKRQLKAMEMNLVVNSIQSNIGSDDDPTSLNSTTSSTKDNGQQDDNNSNHSNQSLEHLADEQRRGSSSSRRRRKSVPYKATGITEENSATMIENMIETEDDDNLSSQSGRSPSSVKDEDSNGSNNNDEQLNHEQVNDS